MTFRRFWVSFMVKKLKNVIKTANLRIQKWKFTVHPLFIIFGIVFLFFGKFYVFLMTTVFCVFHELSHAMVARKLGYALNKIRLMPFGAELSGDDRFLPGHEFFVAVAGPLFNFLICLLCVVSWWIFPECYLVTSEICAVNLVLAVFNLLPFFPLDGGRVFVSFLSKRFEREKSVRLAKNCTLVFSVILFVLFLTSFFFSPNFSFGVISVFLFVAAIFENKNLAYERLTSKQFKQKRIRTNGLEQRRIMIDENSTLQKLFLMQNPRFFIVFVIIDTKFDKIFEISEIELEEFLQNFPAHTVVKNLKNKSM